MLAVGQISWETLRGPKRVEPRRVLHGSQRVGGGCDLWGFLKCGSISEARGAKPWQKPVLCSSSECFPLVAALADEIFTHELQSGPRDAAPAQAPTCSSIAAPDALERMPEGEADWSLVEAQVQPQPGPKGGQPQPRRGLPCLLPT